MKLQRTSRERGCPNQRFTKIKFSNLFVPSSFESAPRQLPNVNLVRNIQFNMPDTAAALTLEIWIAVKGSYPAASDSSTPLVGHWWGHPHELLKNNREIKCLMRQFGGQPSNFYVINQYLTTYINILHEY